MPVREDLLKPQQQARLVRWKGIIISPLKRKEFISVLPPVIIYF